MWGQTYPPFVLFLAIAEEPQERLGSIFEQARHGLLVHSTAKDLNQWMRLTSGGAKLTSIQKPGFHRHVAVCATQGEVQWPQSKRRGLPG